MYFVSVATNYYKYFLQYLNQRHRVIPIDGGLILMNKITPLVYLNYWYKIHRYILNPTLSPKEQIAEQVYKFIISCSFFIDGF